MNWTFSDNVRRLRRKSLLGQLVLVALGVELLMFASFTCLQLPTPTQHNLERLINKNCQHLLVYLSPEYQQRALDEFPVLRQPVPPIRKSPYVPVSAMAVFVGYVFGVPLGLISTGVFLLMGLVGPYINVLPLAAGGGFAYYKQPTCGYLIGLMAGAWIAGRLTLGSATTVRQILATVGGLFMIHVFGLLYLVGGALGLLMFQGDSAYMNWQPWLFESIRNLSWYQLPYDAFFTLALIGIGFPFRWLTGVVTAPDVVMRPKPKWDPQLERVS